MRVEWFLIVAAYISLGVQAYLDLGRGPLFPEILKELSITTKEGGWFFSSTSLFMLFGSFAASSLLKKINSVRTLLVFLIILIFGQYSLYSAQGLVELVVSGVFLGLGFGGMGVCQNLMISIASPEAYHRRLYGGLQSMYALAALLAPLTISRALAGDWQWREVVKLELYAPVMMFFVFLSYSLFFRKRPKKQENEEAKNQDTDSRISYKMKILSAMGLAMYVVAELVVSIWLVVFLQKENNFDTSLSGDALSLFFALLLSGRVFMSFKELHFSSFKILNFCYLSSGVLLIIGLTVNPWFIPLSGVTMSVCFPTYLSYMGENWRNKLDQVMPYCIGGMSFIVSIAHSIAGFLGENFGLYAAMSLAVFGAFSAFFFVNVIERIFQKQRL